MIQISEAARTKKFLVVLSALVLIIGLVVIYAGPGFAQGSIACADNRDNADPEDTLADEDDPGCHTDGDATDGDDTYDPTDDNERNKPECADDRDNADPEDTLADADDPGCHSDGDPDNPDSYTPLDNDETNPAPDTECSDGVDNDDPEDTVADEDDPGCHTDGDPGNPDSYDPDDDDETDEVPAPECSDDVDNDDPEDTVADEADPGCHTDGDAGNPDSYDPDDDDETDEAAEGNFTCRASAYRLEGTPFNVIVDEDPYEPVVANDAEDPCATESDAEIDESVGGAPGSVSSTGLFADTDESGTAEAGAADAAIADSLGVTVLGAENLSANAEAGCDADGNPTLTGSSFVGTVTLFGESEAVGTEHEEIEIPGVGTLHLNETIVEDTGDGERLTQRAFWLETEDAGDIIFGEAVADYHGDPC